MNSESDGEYVHTPIILSAAALFLAGTALSQERPRPPTAAMKRDGSPQTAQVPDGVERIRDIEFGKGGGRALKLHILRPKPLPKEPMPVVVFIPGGGWGAGNKEIGIGPLAQFVVQGYVATARPSWKRKNWPATPTCE